MMNLLDKLESSHTLRREECAQLLERWREVNAEDLFRRARALREQVYGREVFLRGLIEISSYCKNNCLYCGIRHGNENAGRYRLDEAQILRRCEAGHARGLRTFVLQGGEDPWFTDERVCRIIREIKRAFPDSAVTLSLGERPRASYAALREAGADRYLLRHETADADHYATLHPPALTLRVRKQCLRDLRDLGFQVGAGFMVGSPGQTAATLTEDLLFLQELRPQMVGIGPFIPHHDTPFAAKPAGSAEQTLFLLAVVRLLLPHALLPATTALGTVASNGWERGMLAGANVIMPNLTPAEQRGNYLLYDNKNSTALEDMERIAARMEAIGYHVAQSRGDCRTWPPPHWRPARSKLFGESSLPAGSSCGKPAT